MTSSSTTSFMVKAILIAGMLVTGTTNTVSKKLQNQSHVDGHKFKYPWTQTAVMFLGECVCLFVWLYRTHVSSGGTARRFAMSQGRVALLTPGPSFDTPSSGKYSSLPHAVQHGTPLTSASAAEEQRTWHCGGLLPVSPFLFLAPAVCDLLGTTLAGIGLLYVSASVWQMLRGAIIIFSAILSVKFLARKYYRNPHYVGLFIVTVGLALVGTSSLLDDSGDESDSKMVLGLVCIVLGQLASASQMIIEETYLKNRSLDPLLVVGMEGLWGASITIAIVLPVLYAIPGSDEGSYENCLRALRMIRDDNQLLAYILLYWASIAGYNFFGLSVAKSLTTVHRTLIDALRTISVWVTELITYYLITESLGEEWNRWSLLQLAGFLLLFLGTLFFNGIIRLGTPNTDDSNDNHNHNDNDDDDTALLESDIEYVLED